MAILPFSWSLRDVVLEALLMPQGVQQEALARFLWKRGFQRDSRSGDESGETKSAFEVER
jgi:hypothetical protein